MSEAEPPGPAFEDRAIRWAVFKGVVRTAFAALATWILIVFAAQTASWGLQGALGRRDRAERVVEIGLAVAHPEYRVSGWGCCNVGLLSLTVGPMELEPEGPQPVPVTVEVEPKLDIWGHIVPGSAQVPDTALGQAILDGHERGAGSEEVLTRLPADLVASAVVYFPSPVDQETLGTFEDRWGVVPWVTLLFASGPDGPGDGGSWWHPVGWQGSPIESYGGSMAGFKAWTDDLTQADDGTLADLGLPGSAKLRELAARGPIGVVLGSVPVSTLQRMLDDPEVSSVVVGEAIFDVGGGSGHDARG